MQLSPALADTGVYVCVLFGVITDLWKWSSHGLSYACFMLVSKIDHHRRRRSACWRVTRPLLALFSLYSLYNSLSPLYFFFPHFDGVLFCHWCICEMCGLIYDGAFADSQSGSNEGERKREWQRGGERERENEFGRTAGGNEETGENCSIFKQAHQFHVKGFFEFSLWSFVVRSPPFWSLAFSCCLLLTICIIIKFQLLRTCEELVCCSR